MSRIYFHSEHDEAEVRGYERAWAGWLCGDLLASSLHIPSYEGSRPSPLRKVVSGYVSTSPSERFERDMLMFVHGISDNKFILGDRTVSTFSVALNTAMVMGSDPVRLLARLHGQCELHCYVEGAHRTWLAGIIEQGREAGIMRPESGWEEVVTLLRSRDDGPVVCSFSGTEQFPNPQAAEWPPPADENGEPIWDAWYELSYEERWRMSIEGLRSGSMGKWLEMKPDNWADFYSGDGTTGFDVRAYADSLVEQGEHA